MQQQEVCTVSSIVNSLNQLGKAVVCLQEPKAGAVTQF